MLKHCHFINLSNNCSTFLIYDRKNSNIFTRIYLRENFLDWVQFLFSVWPTLEKKLLSCCVISFEVRYLLLHSYCSNFSNVATLLLLQLHFHNCRYQMIFTVLVSNSPVFDAKMSKKVYGCNWSETNSTKKIFVDK